ncbi:MAG: hypothetical protein ACRDJV_15705 [Actinomycetota bacterium]
MSTVAQAPPGSTSIPIARPLGVLASGIVAGAIAGFIAGGIGSRAAMRILALTSPDAGGATTEAGATVGDISAGGTLFLLLAGTALGLGGGLAYIAVRRWLPRRATGVVFGLLLLALSGRPLVHPDNVDFIILEPAWLGIALFASLPILFGLLVVPLQARLEPLFTAERSRLWTVVVVGAGLLPLALGGPVALVLAVLVALGLIMARSEGLRDAWNAPPVDTLGRVLLTILGLFGLVMFSRGAIQILF